MKTYQVTNTKTGYIEVKANSAEEAEEMALNYESEGSLYMDIFVDSVEDENNND